MKNKLWKSWQWVWMSFADEFGFKGVVIIQALDVVEAARLTHKMGINPGGEIMCFSFPPGLVPLLSM